MSFDISKMPKYISRVATGANFLGKAILDATTIDFLMGAKNSFHPNVKGYAAIDLMDSEIEYQDGTIAGLTDGKNKTIFDYVELNPRNIKTTSPYTQFELETLWLKYGLKAGQDYTELAFASDILENLTAQISATNEKLLWLGDTASTDKNMKWTDGFIKRIKGSAALDLTAYLTGDTLLKKLRAVYSSIDEVVRQKDDFRLIVSFGVYQLITGDTFDLNLFKAADEHYLPGTDCRVEIASGLVGTNFACFCRLQSLHVGTDLTSDLNRIKTVYGEVQETIYLNGRFTLGTGIAYAEEMVWVDLSEHVIQPAAARMVATATKTTKA